MLNLVNKIQLIAERNAADHEIVVENFSYREIRVLFAVFTCELPKQSEFSWEGFLEHTQGQYNELCHLRERLRENQKGYTELRERWFKAKAILEAFTNTEIEDDPDSEFFTRWKKLINEAMDLIG